MSVTTPSANSRGLLAELDARFRSPLNRFFHRRTQNQAEAEDLTQEVFLRVARRDEQSTPENIDAFIFAIASNLLRDRGRRRAVRGVAVDAEELMARGQTPDSALVEEIDPQRVLSAKEDLRRVLAAINELPVRTQDAFVLRRMEGMSIKEVANALGVSVSAVEKHLARAVAHLAARLDD